MDETKALLDEDERVNSISCGALHTLVKTGKFYLLKNFLFDAKIKTNFLLVDLEKHMHWEMARQEILHNLSLLTS